MHTVEVKYQIIDEYNDMNHKKTTDEKTITVSGDIFFDDMVKNLINDTGFGFAYPIINQMYDKTWNKILSKEITNYIDKSCIADYIMPHYRVIDMQNLFDFFDEKLIINIIIGGIGGVICEKEGIQFIINPNEADRHRFEPHIHCKYNNEEFRLRLDTCEIMKSDKPFKNKRKVKVAKKWVMKNKNELLRLYNDFAIKGISIPFKITI